MTGTPDTIAQVVRTVAAARAAGLFVTCIPGGATLWSVKRFFGWTAPVDQFEAAA